MKKPNFEAFADEILAIIWEGNEIDGGTVQEIAFAHGLIVEYEATEPCYKNCACAQWGEFPVPCYRKAY